MNRITTLFFAAFVIPALVYFASPQIVQAVSPAPDGGYPGGNTAEGQNALFSLTTGGYNTAVGYFSLGSDAKGQLNTALGAGALLANVGDTSTGEGTLNTATGAAALFSNTTGYLNTANGAFSLFSNTTGYLNTATGRFALFSNTTGIQNTADGASALYSNTTGGDNTAVGRLSLYSNTTGNFNAAVGYQSLYSNTTGSNNTALGIQALYSNTTADGNTAIGNTALNANTTGDGNTAVGFATLGLNTTGSNNVAIGSYALQFDTTGSANTATGFEALSGNNGSANTAFGADALGNNTSGNSCVAIGANALLNSNGSNNVALGTGAGNNLTTANNVICVGNLAGTSHQIGDNDLYLGNPGVDTESGTVRLGTGDGVHTRMFLAGVRGVTTGQANAIPVLIDGAGQLGTASSSRRFKHDIKPMDEASTAILALKPVTFHYKSDNTNTAQFGLIAEEVANVDPDLVVRDDKGEIYTVRYDAVNAMLLNEFLKEHKKVEQQTLEIQEQKQTISELKKGIDGVVAQLKQQASKIQRVSVGLELRKSPTQIVAVKN